MKIRILPVVFVACVFLLALASPASAQSSGALNVKNYGAKGNGTVDDTAAINSAVAALPVSGGALYFPPGTYLVSSTITINVPVTIFGDGEASNNQSQQISQISCTSSGADCIKATGQYAYVRDLAIVSTVGESGTAPTAGAGFDFYYSGSNSYFTTFTMDHVTVEGFYNDVFSSISEAGDITNSHFYDAYYDGLQLGTGGVSQNLGDFGIVNDVFTCAGTAPNAAIDYEGASGGRINNILVDQGISPHQSDCEYGVYAPIGGPDFIQASHFEHTKTMSLYLSSGGMISGNQFVQNHTVGPSVEIVEGQPNLIGPNVFENATGTMIPYAILFGPANFSTVVLPQCLAGYAAGQSGLPLYAGSGNGDLSTFGTFPYSLPGAVAAAPTFMPAGGTYAAPQSVAISDATSGALIYYTTDGSSPTASSTSYSSTISVSSTETIQALAVAPGYSNSNIATATYTIQSPPDFGLGLSTSTLNVPSGGSGLPITVTVTPMNGLSTQVSFACLGLPSNTGCNFVPATVTLARGASSTTQLTVTNSGTAELAHPNWFPSIPATALGALIGFIRFRRRHSLRWFVLTAMLLSVSIGCGGSPKSTSPVTTTVIVIATAGTLEHTNSFALTVQ